MSEQALAQGTAKTVMNDVERRYRLQELLVPPLDGALEAAASKACLCRRGQPCLSGCPDCLHPIRECIAGTVHFVNGAECGVCSYMSRFGSGSLCNCPLRIEIYKRTGV